MKTNDFSYCVIIYIVRNQFHTYGIFIVDVNYRSKPKILKYLIL